MNFSDSWRSLWPIGAVPPSPNLISGHESTYLGPLLFRRSQPSRTILASPSLVLRVPPPPVSPATILADVQTVCRCHDTGFLLSTACQYDLAAYIATSLDSACDPLDSLSRNNLHSLPCRDGSSLLLFFPTGENADEIGFLCLKFKGENLKPDVRVDLDGDIFKQREGLKHPRHRILKISVVQSQANSSLPSSNNVIEGFLMATTMYSVNWFRVETKNSDKGMTRHLLVPLANKDFQCLVVDACWSQHFSEECAVLLKSGKLYLFNVITKRDVKLSVLSGTNGDSSLLGCKFGAQPWVILVASSIAVILIDLRSNRRQEEPKVLARVKLPDFFGVVSVMEEDDTFRAFCRADYSNFHFTTVTERMLLLFDTREPLIPVLAWVHGLDNPTHVSMFRLSELRSSEDFKCSSESGFVILVGSFKTNEFKLFCYGSSDKGPFRSSLYAWELPSLLSLSDRQWSSPDELVREMMLKEKAFNKEMLLRKNFSGFCVVPDSLLKSKPKPSGFVLIKLMLSGKLEIQEYHASRDSSSDKHICEGADIQEDDFAIYDVHESGAAADGLSCFKLCCLYTYMKGNLSTMLTNLCSKLNQKARKQKLLCDDVREVMSSRVHFSNVSISNIISDTSIPINAFEIASRRLLTTLKPNILSLAFSKYEDLFKRKSESSFLPLELPNCLPHHQFTHFFVNIPSSRSRRGLDAEVILGPVLPLPVLLVLQQMDMGKEGFSIKEELDDDLLDLECKSALENAFPETSIADTRGFSGYGASQELLDDKQFFVCHHTLRDYVLTFNDSSSTTPSNKEGYNQIDEKFMTFICGISIEDCSADGGHEMPNTENFDLSPLKMDFEPLDFTPQPIEQKSLLSLKRQASNWLENNKLYQNFCSSSKIQKSK